MRGLSFTAALILASMPTVSFSQANPLPFDYTHSVPDLSVVAPNAFPQK
jgi:hypothetical protein